ncbi:MAG: acyl-CoA thioesterase [Desulfarculaceae bacterium]|nr:acyl-CoA thioesterase [Desulfarculaceae bacterium]
MTRRKKTYFQQGTGPEPITATVEKRISFSETDAMAIVWHGRYPALFEQACEKLARKAGLSYQSYFEHNLRAPIVQMHVDYFAPLALEEKVRIQAALIWSRAARLNTEYRIWKENGTTAATGYTVQMLTDADTGSFCLSDPPLLRQIKEQWYNGNFS